MYEIRQMIQRLRLGESNRAVARAQGVGRDTVGRVRDIAAAQNWLEATNPLPDDATIARYYQTAGKGTSAGAGKNPTHLSTVEPFREKVLEWHRQGIAVSSIRQALARQYSYGGSVHAVYRFLRSEAAPAPVATVMLDFAVGEQAQVDFGSGPLITDRHSGEVFKTWFFVMTLSWSRHQYAELVRNQSVETWLACHRHAFEWFNGVPRKVRIDNPKCAITRACYYEPTVQRAYAELALGYAFVIDPCPVADPAKKGRVESGVKYVKGNFMPLREFHGLVHANAQLHEWIQGEAGNRLHGSTRERPLMRFNETEQALLQPLPAVAPTCPTWAKGKLHGNGHVQHAYCHYSAPFRLIHQTLWLEITPDVVRIYHEHELVAIHPRLFKAGTRSTVEDHLPPDAQAYFMRDPQWCLTQATAVGPACRAVVESLFAKRVLDQLRAVQGLLRLADQFGRGRLDAACSRALNFGTPSYRTIKQILKTGLDQQPELIDAPTLEAPYLSGGHFRRQSSDLLH
ncbi:IS21 family transposase [Candidatus Accumulibacter sp. ACC003]|uniref:IS21 family transposase n=1 Tax=Candidatus Accumulibacter sp. ACC003 TaxID=2823334 RepID=UPI0025C28953|nr:IS21 family transposase [Candidatus Accumulibacter sp. ACC003]